MKLNVSELSTEIGAFENATIFKHGLDRVRTQSFLPPSIRPSVNILPSHRPANEGENVEKLIFALSSNLRKSASPLANHKKANKLVNHKSK